MRVLGYGGLGNTNGARTFAGKEAVAAVTGWLLYYLRRRGH